MKNSILHYGLIRTIVLLHILLFGGVLCFAQSGGAIYEAGPTMMRAKLYPVSTVLDNGKVISFGGRESGFVSCGYSDLYDPVANSFTESPMKFPHDMAFVVKLTDGRYFIVGGCYDAGVPAYSSTEMYDETSNTFEAGPSMTMGRMMVGATQLNNGKVLITGGWYDPNGATYGEIYDPTANTFLPTAALISPRAQPTVLPTSDGGAVIAGGLQTYGSNSITVVEYYQPETNDFVLQSSELIPSDPNGGWLLLNDFTKPINDIHMTDGHYLLLAYRTSPSTEYILVTFDPVTKLFEKVVTDTPLIDLLTDGGFFTLVLNKEKNLAYVMGVDAGSNPQKLSMVTVSLTSGKVAHPLESYTLPNQEYFFATMTYIPSNGKILVQGINASNNSYFTGTNRTYLITPQSFLGTPGLPAKEQQHFVCYPNPVKDQLNIKTNFEQQTNLQMTLSDITGRKIVYKAMNLGPGKQILTWNITQLPDGVYKLTVMNNKIIHTETVVIAR